MKIQIITDASCDLPKERLEALGVDTIPGVVYIGERDFLDHETLLPHNIKELTAQGSHIKLYEANEILFYTRLKEYAQHKEKVLYIGSSRALYDGVDKALLAKKTLLEEFSDFDMTIIDSRSVSLGQGLLVEYICEHIEEVKNQEDLLSVVKKGILKLRQFCLVGQLDTLHHKGFLSASLYMTGKMMGICPVLEFDSKGEIQVREKCKGLANGIAKLIQNFSESVQNPNQSRVGIAYVGEEEMALELRDKLELLGVTKISLYPAGALMGNYLGYKSIGFVFMDN